MGENTAFSDKFAVAIQKDLTKILGEIGGLKTDVAGLKTDVTNIKETMATKEDIRLLRNEIFQEVNGIRGRVDRVEEKVGIKPARV